jgi:hypothetical protein
MIDGEEIIRAKGKVKEGTGGKAEIAKAESRKRCGGGRCVGASVKRKSKHPTFNIQLSTADNETAGQQDHEATRSGGRLTVGEESQPLENAEMLKAVRQ